MDVSKVPLEQQFVYLRRYRQTICGRSLLNN